MILKSVEVKGFRCYKSTEIDLQSDLTLMTGSNDAGKSAFLRAIRLLLSKKQDVEDIDLRTVNGKRETDQVVVTGVFLRHSEKYCLRRVFVKEAEGIQSRYEKLGQVPQDEWLASKAREWADYNKGPKQEVLEEVGLNTSGTVAKIDERFWEHVEEQPTEEAWLPSDPPDDLPEVHFYGSEEANSPHRAIEKEVSKALKEHFSKATEGESYEKLAERMEQEAKSFIAGLSSIFAKYDYRSGEGADNIFSPNVSIDLAKGFTLDTLEIQEGSGHVPLSNLGAAKRRKITLALMDWRRERAEEEMDEVPQQIHLYDEPDIHLDYAGQRKMAGLLRRLGRSEHIQAVVATHSLNMIDRVPVGALVHLDCSDTNGVSSSPSPLYLKDWDEVGRVASSLGIRNHVMLNACVLLVEGPTEELLLPYLYHRYRGYSLQSTGVQLLSRKVDSPGGKDQAWLLARHMLLNNRSAFLVLDRDAELDGTVCEKAIGKFNKRCGHEAISNERNLAFVGEAEIEDEFSDDLLSSATHEYCKWYQSERNSSASLPSLTQCEEYIQSARDEEKGITKAMDSTIGSAHSIKLKIHNGMFANHLIEQLEKRDELPPLPTVEAAFSRLDDYVDAPYSSN